jgi:hypothetical protein
MNWDGGTGMRRNRRSRHPIPGHRRGILAALGALALGLWLGVLAGLATRPRRDQPAGPPRYAPAPDPTPEQSQAST